MGVSQAAPVIADGVFLLHTLNEHLTRTALLVQPLTLPRGADASALRTIDIPLPLPWTSTASSRPETSPSKAAVSCIETSSEQEYEFEMPGEVASALDLLGLSQSLGYLRMVQLPDGSAEAQVPYEEVLHFLPNGLR